MATSVSPDSLALQRLYHWEKTAPTRVTLTQPLGGGAVCNYTWGDVGNQVRRMAAHLQSLGFAPGDRVALVSKNTAHWLMADLAIWMAGYVSVPLYPTLAADEMLAGSQVRRFLVLHKELDADDGELTRTRKVRRGYIGEKYAVLVDALYGGKAEQFIETAVKFEDGRTGSVSATLKIVDAKVLAPVRRAA